MEKLIDLSNHRAVDLAARSLRVTIETIQLDQPTDRSELALKQSLEQALKEGLTAEEIANAQAYGRAKAKPAIARGSRA